MKNYCVILQSGILTIPCEKFEEIPGEKITFFAGGQPIARFRMLAIVGWYIEGVIVPTQPLPTKEVQGVPAK